MKTLQEILEIEGIVIRKIPMTYTSRYRLFPDKVRGHDISLKDAIEKGYEVTEEKDFFWVKEVRKLSLGGKYLITKEYNQDSMVRFNKGYCGIGDTIEAAYQDYFKKH